jgi:hypothetical protein
MNGGKKKKEISLQKPQPMIRPMGKVLANLLRQLWNKSVILGL